jgi:hypothetical protein
MSRAPISRVNTAPVPGDSGTTLSVTVEDGDFLPNAPFDALVWPVQQLPVIGVNACYLHVTAVDGDEFTFIRETPTISIQSGLMFASVSTVPVHSLGDTFDVQPLGAFGDPDYSLHLTTPQGATEIIDCGGTALVTFEPDGSGLATWHAEESGTYYYAFEDNAGLRTPDESFFVRYSEVA